MTVLSEEINVEDHSLKEVYADELFSVELTKGIVHVTLGAIRIDHRGSKPVRSRVPVARLILSNKVARELCEALGIAADNMDKVTSDETRAALTLAKPKGH